MTQARTARTARYRSRVKWFGNQLAAGVTLAMQSRVKIAAELLKSKVQINLMKPVRKYGMPVMVDPSSRSKPGEFPRADTTRLYKSIFWKMTGRTSAIIGTPLKYGLRLELKMNRSFLRRTLYAEVAMLRRVLTAGVNVSSRFKVS